MAPFCVCGLARRRGSPSARRVRVDASLAAKLDSIWLSLQGQRLVVNRLIKRFSEAAEASPETADVCAKFLENASPWLRWLRACCICNRVGCILNARAKITEEIAQKVCNLSLEGLGPSAISRRLAADGVHITRQAIERFLAARVAVARVHASPIPIAARPVRPAVAASFAEELDAIWTSLRGQRLVASRLIRKFANVATESLEHADVCAKYLEIGRRQAETRLRLLEVRRDVIAAATARDAHWQAMTPAEQRKQVADARERLASIEDGIEKEEES